MPGYCPYGMAKAAIAKFTEDCAVTVPGIRHNGVLPGFIETPLFHSVTDGEVMADVKERIRVQHKLDRFGKPEEIAGAAFFLASEDSSFVTGQAIAVDGGFTAGKAFGIASMMGLE